MKKRTLTNLLASIVVGAAICAVYAQPAQNGQRQGGAPSGFGAMAAFQPAPAGPPAPVPAEVAIARPTLAEVDLMNVNIKKMIETSPDKELLKKYESLLIVQPPRANSAVAPVQTFVRNNQRHARYVETANTGDFDILFLGDSITDFWQTRGTNSFAGLKIANFAVSGDTTQGVLWGLKNGEAQGRKPKAIMLMIGTNNTGGNTGPEIAEGIGAIVLELRKDFPDAKILLLAIFPRGNSSSDGLRQKNDEANKLIARLDDGQHVFFQNINSKFMDQDGRLIGFRPDNLHPDAKGYQIWADAVLPTLKSWVN